MKQLNYLLYVKISYSIFWNSWTTYVKISNSIFWKAELPELMSSAHQPTQLSYLSKPAGQPSAKTANQLVLNLAICSNFAYCDDICRVDVSIVCLLKQRSA
jgi:hypothetical protein